MKKVLCAVLKETKRIPAEFINGAGLSKIRIDFEHGLVYPIVKDIQEEDILAIFNRVFPNLKEFRDTFHKSWEKIKDTPQEDLWSQAVLHYFTTYGLESLNINNEGCVYLPDEIDCTPELRQFRVILTISNEELKTFINDTLSSGVALKQSTIQNYLTILDYFKWEYDTEKIKNKEMKTIFQAKLKVIPKTGEEIVRLLHYLFTGETMLVKNYKTFRALQYCPIDQKPYVSILLEKGQKQCAEVFYRYKAVFMGLRHAGFKSEVNKISRLAKEYWKPMPVVPFMSSRILGDEEVKMEDIQQLPTFDLVKIYNKLQYVYTSMKEYGHYYDMFVVRSGSLYIDKKPKKISGKQQDWLKYALIDILLLLKSRFSQTGKSYLLLPEGLDIAYPTSEKSFIGDLPLYSRVVCDASSVIGISWKREDLDLSALLEDGGKVGWDSHYSSRTGQVMYSGDCTRGGAEAIYFNSPQKALIMMNLYFGDIPEVNLFISNEKEFNVKEVEDPYRYRQKKYIYDPNNIIYSTKLAIDSESKVLGLYEKQKNKTTFTFVDMSIANGRVCSNSELTQIAMEVLDLRGKTALKLSELCDTVTQDELDVIIAKIRIDDEDGSVEQGFREKILDLTEPDKASILSILNDLPKTK